MVKPISPDKFKTWSSRAVSTRMVVSRLDSEARRAAPFAAGAADFLVGAVAAAAGVGTLADAGVPVVWAGVALFAVMAA